MDNYNVKNVKFKMMAILIWGNLI